MKTTFILILMAILSLPIILIAQNAPNGQILMHKVKKDPTGSTPLEILVPIPNNPQACSPPNPTSISCGGSATFNITNSGYVGGLPTSNGSCGQCCYAGSDLDCDGGEDVSFSVENSKWYKYCNSTSLVATLQFDVDEPGSGSTCNLQGACWVGTALNSATISCNNPQNQEYGSNPGGNADGFTFSNITVQPGECAYIMIDGYAGAQCSGVVLSATCTLLPVRFSSFTLQANGKAANINWSTSSEINNAYFVVERSIDAVNYSAIATVTAKGNSSTTTSYHITDNTLTKGTFYYRVRQVDRDGVRSYTDIKSVRINSQSVFTVVFNGGVSYANVIFDAGTSTNSRINLFDNSGRLVSSKQVNYTAGYNNLQVDISTLPKGMYFLSMNVDGTEQKGKIVKY